MAYRTMALQRARPLAKLQCGNPTPQTITEACESLSTPSADLNARDTPCQRSWPCALRHQVRCWHSHHQGPSVRRRTARLRSSHDRLPSIWGSQEMRTNFKRPARRCVRSIHEYSREIVGDPCRRRESQHRPVRYLQTRKRSDKCAWLRKTKREDGPNESRRGRLRISLTCQTTAVCARQRASDRAHLPLRFFCSCSEFGCEKTQRLRSGVGYSPRTSASNLQQVNATPFRGVSRCSDRVSASRATHCFE